MAGLLDAPVQVHWVRDEQQLPAEPCALVLLAGGDVAAGWQFLGRPRVRHWLTRCHARADSLMIGISAGAIHLGRGVNPGRPELGCQTYLGWLPEPVAEDYAASDYVAPRNSTEQILVAVWSEVLEQDKVGIYDDFFDLGGHSLLINKVATRLKQQTGVELPLRTLFEVPTIAALAEIINSLAPAATEYDGVGEDADDYEEGSL